jgi:death-on-curing protein
MEEGEVLTIHSMQLAQTGGADGVRDRGLLDSALARPKNVYAYASQRPTIARMAAAYAFGIASNHPFMDGNKRTALVVSFVFLDVNGVQVDATQEDTYVTFMRLAAGKISESELAAWFAEHCSLIGE